MSTTEQTYQVEGMTCGGCASSVTKAIENLGPLKVDVNLESGAVKVKGEHDPAAVKQAVEDAGFDVVG